MSLCLICVWYKYTLLNAYKKEQDIIILPSKVSTTTGITIGDIGHLCVRYKTSDTWTQKVCGFYVACGVVCTNYVLSLKQL